MSDDAPSPEPSSPVRATPGDAAVPQAAPNPLFAELSNSAKKARRSRRWLLPTVTGVVGVLVGAGGMMLISWAHSAADARAEQKGATAQESAAAARASRLPDAIAPCNTKDGFRLGDDGTTLTFDMRGKKDTSGAAIGDIQCVFRRLGMPASVSAHIDQTTALDGRQTEAWDSWTVSWSFHPDRGLDGVITLAATS